MDEATSLARWSIVRIPLAGILGMRGAYVRVYGVSLAGTLWSNKLYPYKPGLVILAGSRMRFSSSSESEVFSRATSRTVLPVL